MLGWIAISTWAPFAVIHVLLGKSARPWQWPFIPVSVLGTALIELARVRPSLKAMLTLLGVVLGMFAALVALALAAEHSSSTVAAVVLVAFYVLLLAASGWLLVRFVRIRLHDRGRYRSWTREQTPVTAEVLVSRLGELRTATAVTRYLQYVRASRGVRIDDGDGFLYDLLAAAQLDPDQEDPAAADNGAWPATRFGDWARGNGPVLARLQRAAAGDGAVVDELGRLIEATEKRSAPAA